MKYIRLTFVFFVLCITNACDTDPQQNAIQDKIYSDQFDAINKAKQVENVLQNAAQAQRDAIDAQAN